MNELQICVYTDTIESHDNDTNLSLVTVNKDIAEQYVKECKNEYFNSFEDFFYTYTADDTEDFYKYAKKHNAIIKVEDW